MTAANRASASTIISALGEMGMSNPSPRSSKVPVREHGDESGDEVQRVPVSQLERLAIAARREYFASGGHPLNLAEIEQEVAERRGGSHLSRDQ